MVMLKVAPVEVYRNLHKKSPLGEPVYSVRSKASGLVNRHETHIALEDCVFRVGPKGRERVRSEKRKNVHAYVGGYVSPRPVSWYLERFDSVKVSYNPYEDEGFVTETGEPIKSARVVLFGCGEGSKEVRAILSKIRP